MTFLLGQKVENLFYWSTDITHWSIFP